MSLINLCHHSHCMIQEKTYQLPIITHLHAASDKVLITPLGLGQFVILNLHFDAHAPVAM